VPATIRKGLIARGTILNAAVVAASGGLGLVAGKYLNHQYQDVALHGLGLVVVGIGIKMFLSSRNPIIAASAIVVGGIIGFGLGLQHLVDGLAHWSQVKFGGQAGFSEGLITSFVLFCVGSMTILGCFQDALENKIEILALKSTMDGIAAFFIAAATGAGVLVTAILLFLFQGTITLAAVPLKSITKNESVMAEINGVGGVLLISTGLGLVGIIDLKTTNYLPALILAPCFVALSLKLSSRFGRPITTLEDTNI